MRLPSLLDPPIGFAHRGGCAHAPENTIEAFLLGVRLGATGVESDVWLTADGIPVLVHDGELRLGMRKRPIAGLRRDELPGWLPSLAELYDAVGTELPLSLDVKDPAAAAPVVAVAREAGGGAEANLHLCGNELEATAAWRPLSASARLVHSCRLRDMKEGPERRAAALADTGIDVVNMPHRDWTGGLTTLFHRFDRLCFGWDAQHARQIRELLEMGCDAVYSDHCDRLADELARR